MTITIKSNEDNKYAMMLLAKKLTEGWVVMDITPYHYAEYATAEVYLEDPATWEGDDNHN